MPIRLLLADDHRMFRQGLRELLERQPAIEVVGEAATGPEVIAAVETLRPDIVLLDIQMPGLNGVEVAKRLAASHPEVKLIMLTMYREDQHLIESIRAGARGYLLKDADAEELMTVISRVARGESALDPSLVAGVFAAVRGEIRPGGGPLTERELEIVRLLAAGHDNRTIAARLYLSEKTVANRLSEIFQKLGVTNRTQAALVAIQRGLVSPDEAN
ncbi:MAG: response regulator transcription factor [Chloroflexota bacterium]|nr:response regulator transcription factor [Dehalococcoidia bacterium]MDW8255000.1 response regulator transcription factor [Chloroflexota bacterium]